MIKNFGVFRKKAIQTDPQTGYRFFPLENDDGEDFHLDIVKPQSTYEGSVFIEGDYPYYASVNKDGRVRVVSNEPSLVPPEDGETFIGSSDLINEGDVYDAEENEISTPGVEPQTYFVRSGDLWERLTDEEAEQVEAAIATQPIRIQNIFRARTEYHSDHELFPLLTEIAETLFGSERASVILAPSA